MKTGASLVLLYCGGRTLNLIGHWLEAIWGPLLLNVVGGILAGLMATLWAVTSQKLKNRRFRQIFGNSKQGFTLVYEEMELADHTPENPYRYCRPGGMSAEHRFSITRPIPIASVRAINYLSSAIGNVSGHIPVLRSDITMQTELDVDVVSFGGPRSNLVTANVEQDDGNKLAAFSPDQEAIIHKQSGSALSLPSPDFDYGLILKVRPSEFPHRVWIAIAGFGEWGTSGAAWFLAKKWKEIRKHARAEPFAAIISVHRDKGDQSAKLVRVVTEKQDLQP